MISKIRAENWLKSVKFGAIWVLDDEDYRINSVNAQGMRFDAIHKRKDGDYLVEFKWFNLRWRKTHEEKIS